MKELSFLVELALNHKLQKVTRDLIVARIKELEEQPSSPAQGFQPIKYMEGPGFDPRRGPVAGIANQAPSTQAILARNPDLIPEPQPVAVIAQTPATAEAMAQRQRTIALAQSGKSEPGRTSPRKF